MCLLIHKPAGVEVPDLLLTSAAEYNPHGFGIMVLHKDGQLELRRRTRTHINTLRKIYAQFRDQECVLHFRYGTSGDIDHMNTHPFKLTRHIYMAHSGTIELERHSQQRSDTWHFATDYLRPILKNRPEALYETGFHNLIKAWAGTSNRFVFMDARKGQTVIINREHGFDIDGLWLSNTRWFDASKFHWHKASVNIESKVQGAVFLS